VCVACCLPAHSDGVCRCCVQRGETIESTNDALLRTALSPLFSRELFLEITGIDVDSLHLVQTLQQKFLSAVSPYSSPLDPPTPAVWICKLLVSAITRVAKSAFVFRDSCAALAALAKRSMTMCTEGVWRAVWLPVAFSVRALLCLAMMTSC